MFICRLNTSRALSHYELNRGRHSLHGLTRSWARIRWSKSTRPKPLAGVGSDRTSNRLTVSCTGVTPCFRHPEPFVQRLLAQASVGWRRSLARLRIGVDSTGDSIGGISPTILVPVQKPVESEQMLGFSGGHPFVPGKPTTGPDPAKPPCGRGSARRRRARRSRSGRRRGPSRRVVVRTRSDPADGLGPDPRKPPDAPVAAPDRAAISPRPPPT